MSVHIPRSQPGSTVLSRVPAQVTRPADHWRSMLAKADRACCCPALPAVAAIVPPGPGRSEGTDLLLCRHHLRGSRHALAAIGAFIFDPEEGPERPEEPQTVTATGR